MSNLESGKILVAECQEVYIIRMSGDVRLTLCIAFDECIEALFAQNHFKRVIFDLSKAKNLDSTTLGFIAKVAIKCRTKKMPKPVVFYRQYSIKRLLDTMGINDICKVIDKSPSELDESVYYQSLISDESQDEETVKSKVLEAHETLACLNDNNRKNFTDLIRALKSA